MNYRAYLKYWLPVGCLVIALGAVINSVILAAVVLTLLLGGHVDWSGLLP